MWFVARKNFLLYSRVLYILKVQQNYFQIYIYLNFFKQNFSFRVENEINFWKN